MKKSMIIGKKHIVLASLTLVLAAAVYVNWIFAKTDEQDYDITAQLAADSDAVTETETVAAIPGESKESDSSQSEPSGKTLGESELVDSKAIAGENYFALASIAKLRARDEAIDTISLVLNDENADEASKTAASDKALLLSEHIEAETTIENLIKSKGFSDCMVYLNGESANVVVKCADMNAQKATQIKELVLSESNILAENISIIDLQ